MGFSCYGGFNSLETAILNVVHIPVYFLVLYVSWFLPSLILSSS